MIEVDNEQHCDFVKLRQMLVRTHMEELREYTNDVLYEDYRTDKLKGMGVNQDETVFRETKWVFPFPCDSFQGEMKAGVGKWQEVEPRTRDVIGEWEEGGDG